MFSSNFAKSFFFFLKKYLLNKAGSLKNAEKEEIQALLPALVEAETMEELESAVKTLRNRGLGGINTYISPLKRLFLFLTEKEIESIKSVDEKILIEFLENAEGSAITKSSMRKIIINFFSFVGDLTGAKYRIKLKKWKTREKEYPTLTLEETHLFLANLEDLHIVRDRIILKLLLFSGLRLGQILDLKREQMLATPDIYFFEVNEDEVATVAARHIEKDFDEFIPTDGSLLFTNREGKRLTQAYISRQVDLVLEQSGIKKEKKGADLLSETYKKLHKYIDRL